MLSFFFFLIISQAWSVKADLNLSHNKNVIILAGQSNMAGRGGVVNNTATGTTTWDGVVPPQCQPNPSIHRLSADLAWVQAHEPLHADIDANKTNGVGPGMPFANTVLTHDPTLGSVGLVPCAIGGTNISMWEKGSSLYEQLVRRSKWALLGGGVIRALLWYQGESDTLTQDDAFAYKVRLKKLFQDFRDDLQSPTLLIVQVALASGEGPYVETIREAQLGLDLLNVKCVDANGLPLEPDGLHLTTPAQVQLGQMLADAFLQSLPLSTQAASRLSSSDASTRFSIFICYRLLIQLFLSLLMISRFGYY